MLWALIAGIAGGACAILAVRYFERALQEHKPSEADGIEIIEDDVFL